ncbi:MAG: pyridoxal phosphate-dependent aminotransferase [Candidatus Kerfeldbacteria bacterium]|nr:pyridoxal phosphate-dependent aminotransferase [Candidatus Kerfeldbacteria bacterium]
MPLLSHRIQSAVASPLRKYIPLAEAAKERGTSIYHLNIGQPDLAIPEKMMKSIRAFDHKVLPYSHSAGIAELRDAWAQYYQSYNIPFTRDDILVTTGGSEAMLFSLLAVCDPGDEIIVFEPVYSNYKMYAAMLNVVLVPVPCSAESGYHLPVRAEIEKRVSEKTRAILVVNPNNPTGTVYTDDELKTVVDIVNAHDLFLLADETYREIVFDGETHRSLFSFEGVNPRAIMIDSVSKRFNICGSRMGCIASRNKDLITNMLKAGQARLSPPTLDQYVILDLFPDVKEYTKRVCKIYEERRNVVLGILKSEPSIVTPHPKGAFYIMIGLPVASADDFVKWMLNDFSRNGKTTMVSPCEDFYITPGKGKNEIRIAYVLETDQLKDAMEILVDGVREYQKNH